MDDLTFFLTSPLYVAEMYIKAKLPYPTEQQLDMVTRLRENVVKAYLKAITRPDATFDISTIDSQLGSGLVNLYINLQKAHLSLPTKAIYVHPNVSIDWHTVLSGFIAVRNGQKRQLCNVLSERLIDDILRIQFTEVVLALAADNAYYSKETIEKVFTSGLGSELLEQAAARRLDSHFDYIDSLHLLEAIEKTSGIVLDLDFIIEKGVRTGFRIGDLSIYKEDIDTVAAGLTGIINLYQKKGAQLKHRAKKGVTDPPKELPYDETEQQEIIKLILAPLNGLNPQKQRIMGTEEFQRLITYTNHLVTTDALPTNIKPIRQTNISAAHIRYTLYCLHKQLFGTNSIKHVFIEFLHAVFLQFSTWDIKTTKRKFATAPDSYFRDFAGYIGDEV